MKFSTPVNIESIASLIGATLIGDNHGEATGINELHKVEPGDLVFVDHPKYYNKCLNSDATFIIINKETDIPAGKSILLTENPFEAYCTIINHFRPFTKAAALINTDSIGEGTYIYPGAFIGNNVTIGSNCIIHPNVTVMDHCIIGNNVIIQANTVIGSDAFYYNTKKDREVWYKKMPSGGTVIIEDDVEIGSGCTIDRGVTHDTRIGKGTKLDNMIHIGHDTVLGDNCLMAAQSAIAGMVTLGNGVTVWGQVGISKTLSIGDNVVLLAKSGVGGDLEGNKIYFGAPVEEAGIKKRELVWIKRIPELWEKVMGGERYK
ncbi:MAG: UDP-3-O-(3-hydroxymyristoyl)glucosamine N-acyltransferase [Ferruginibacter sp.]